MLIFVCISLQAQNLTLWVVRQFARALKRTCVMQAYTFFSSLRTRSRENRGRRRFLTPTFDAYLFRIVVVPPDARSGNLRTYTL